MIRNRFLAVALSLLVLAGFVDSSFGHPVPKRAHDRTIDLQILRGDNKEQVVVRVRYRLEVDEFTVVFEDLPALGERVDLKSLREPREFYDAYVKNYAPILADNLRPKMDGRLVPLTCRSATHTLRDEMDVPLGHLRCDFVFETSAISLPAGEKHHVNFREGNFEFEEGRILLSLTRTPGVVFETVQEPDQALKEKARVDLKPGEDARLRVIDAAFTLGEIGSQANTTAAPQTPPEGKNPQASSGEGQDRSTLLELLLDSKRGLMVLLLLAAGFGAAHALTPGHGKTLVAAYLVGERGTAFHAIVLGLVTTITHTGAVIVLAALLLFLFPKAVPAELQMTLGFVGGLLITGMGLWLLLRRLGGGADHIHLGGGGQHHHHGHHHHHEQAAAPQDKKVSWTGLILLGITGGIVPCWDAILMLGFAISAQRLWLALPLLLAFSAGLAGVLVVIGLAVVYLKGFADSRMGESRLVRLLPLASAVLVTLMGLGLCYESVHSTPSPAAPAAERRASDV